MEPKKIDNIRFAVLSTDIACFRIINNQLCVLIGKAPEESPFAGKWTLIGGMILPNETAEEAVSRLLLNKAGINKMYTEQVYTFSAIDRDPRGRVVSVSYIGLTFEDSQNTSQALFETKWCPFKDLPSLGYDHDQIIAYALDKLRNKVRSTNCIQYLLPKECTLSEIQNTYEIVIGEKVDKRNFRKKILQSGILKDTKRTKKQGVMRPATLYVFTSQKNQTIENL